VPLCNTLRHKWGNTTSIETLRGNTTRHNRPW